MFEQGRELLRRWFSGVEAQLIAEARRAGVFQHPTLTGGTREKIVRNALREILPAQVEIGSGKVIGADCEPSKQMDIVVFDGRFPVLRMESESLFPGEGVIATTEVKSELSESELRGALANAASVMQISPTFIKEDADAWIAEQQAQGATLQFRHRRN